MTKHYVLGPCKVGKGPDGGVPYLTPALADLCAYGVDNGYSHLWVLPSADITPDRAYVEASRGLWDLKACTWQYKNAPAIRESRGNILNQEQRASQFKDDVFRILQGNGGPEGEQ